MKKNFLLLLSSTIISLVFLYTILLIYTFLTIDKSIEYKFNSLKNLNFHKNYSNKIHHLRGGEEWFEKNLVASDLLFSTINDFGNNKKNILLQGDSWAEQLTSKDREKYHLARNYVKEISLKNNIGFINAGISSYSPTLMKIQLEVLKKDFNIKPHIVIAYIDQTDIGDENCRYKNRKVYKNNKLIAVREENYSGGIFDYSKIYGESKIFLSKGSKLKKSKDLLNFRIYYDYKKLLKKSSKKINQFFTSNNKNKIVKKCYWPEIQRYLTNSTDDEINYFKKTIIDYVNYLINDKNIEKLILVTFPHKRHLEDSSAENKYKINVSNIIDDLNFKNKKIFHLNFSKFISERKILISQNTYYKNDPSSHLSDDFYANVFMKEIFDKILDLIIK